MDRLRDEAGWDAVSERGIELLRRVPASPSRPDLRRRVWAGLQEIFVSAAVAPHHARLKALALGIVVVASAASAGAAIGGRWIAPRIDRAVAPLAAARTDVQPHRHRTAIRRIADAWEPAEAAAPVAAEPTAAEPVMAAPGADLRAPSQLAQLARPARHGAVQAPEGRTEVLDALVALRRDHDAERAAGLLDRYLVANRHGALREEALVLAIEAADTRGDGVGARRMARLYLFEFPTGRFGQFAGQHLSPPATDGLPARD
jgi:hypothetical protein